MLTPAMIGRLNSQIRLEQYSSNLYLQMSAWCDHQGYTGSATFLREHAAEELQHMYKLFDYVCETGALAVLGAHDAPPPNYKSLAEVFEVTYGHELGITAAINQLVASALAGCATTLPPSAPDCPTPSRPPALRQPTPSQAYSTSVSRNIESWEKSLMGTPVMSKH